MRAEFPPNTPENSLLQDLVGRHQTHKCKRDTCRHGVPDGEEQCNKSFPKPFAPITCCDGDSYPLYRRRNRPQDAWRPPASWKRGSTFIHNSNAVPYNPFLLLKYRCHINVEVVTTLSAIKYLYKYVYKGASRNNASFFSNCHPYTFYAMIRH